MSDVLVFDPVVSRSSETTLGTTDVLTFDGPVLPTVMVMDTGQDVVLITSSGPIGLRGIQGIQGISGGSFVFTQATALAVWDIFYDLPYTPNVIVVDTAGSVLFGDVQIITTGHMILSFSVPISGSAYLS